MENSKVIWFIDPYSNLPKDGMRPGRYHQIAENLSLKGYSVKLFISNYSHQTKQKNPLDKTYFLFDKIEYVILDAKPYLSHISISRIKYEKDFINNFVLYANDAKKPDLIIIRDPALFISTKLISFCKKYNIKYLVDIIDLWPELFELMLPTYLQKFSKFIFSYFYYKRKKLLSKASAYTAVSPDYLKIATNINDNLPSEVIYWGTDIKRIRSLQENTQISILDKFQLTKNKDEFWLIYSGTLGDNYDIKSLFKVANTLQEYPKIKILIAGSGPLEGWINSNLDSLLYDNVFILGQVQSDTLFCLFKYCDIGLCTYASKSTVSMPIKSYDYFAAGLPVINCLGRNLGKIVKEYDLGYNYTSENIESLRNVILSAYSNQDEVAKMKENVVNFSERFDQNLQYNKFADLVDKVCLTSKNYK